MRMAPYNKFSYMRGLRSATVRKVCQDVNPCVPANVHHSDSWVELGERCN